MLERQETAGVASRRAESALCGTLPYATAGRLLQMAVVGRFQHKLTAIPDDQLQVLSGPSASTAGKTIEDVVRTRRDRC